MNPKTTKQLVTQGAALVVGGAAVAAGASYGVNHSFLSGIWPIAKEIIAVALPVIAAYVARGPGHVNE